MEALEPTQFASADEIAQRFVDARLGAISLADYPGPIPPDLESAYACQEAAIALWPDQIAGWKIGRIPPALERHFAQIRLAGPIFRRAVRIARPGEIVPFPVFKGGFAAVEGELVFEIGEDTAPAKKTWTLAEATAVTGRMYLGVETAGSPLATINALGPTVVISDFGNNAGLILGPEVGDWRSRNIAETVCETFIDEQSVGRGNAANLPGGPLEALRFAVEHCARRGRPLKKGMLVSTGAISGVHDILSNQTAVIEFAGMGRICCKAAVKLGKEQA